MMIQSYDLDINVDFKDALISGYVTLQTTRATPLIGESDGVEVRDGLRRLWMLDLYLNPIRQCSGN